MASLIDIKNIKRDFPLGNEIVHVLKGIDLQIDKGEYVAIMGPSGSGKSTLMNLLGCLDTPTSGTYILNNRDVSSMTDDELAEVRNKEIGFVVAKMRQATYQGSEFELFYQVISKLQKTLDEKNT